MQPYREAPRLAIWIAVFVIGCICAIGLANGIYQLGSLIWETVSVWI